MKCYIKNIKLRLISDYNIWYVLYGATKFTGVLSNVNVNMKVKILSNIKCYVNVM